MRPPGWWLAWCKRVPFVFEVRDLWPESLAAVGASSEGKLLHGALGAVAGFLYRRADRSVVVAPAFKGCRPGKVLEMSPTRKISVVENGVETAIFRPEPAAIECKATETGRAFCDLLHRHHGSAHGVLETLIAAAEELQTALPCAVLLIGEGAQKKERIVKLAAGRGLNNIRFLGQQPRQRIPTYVSAANVCLVMLRKSKYSRP